LRSGCQKKLKKYLQAGSTQKYFPDYFYENTTTMKQFFLVGIIVCFTFSAKATNDKELAKNYLFWVWNRDAPDFLISQHPTEKALVEKKFKIAIDNVIKSGINLGTAVITNVYSVDVIGTNKRILLVIYQAGTAQWDDVVLCLEKEKNKIIDIGNVENSFTMNSKTVGQNYAYKENLPIVFDKKAITSLAVQKEVKTLIRLANNSRIDSLCKRVLYTGGDVANRKNRMEACNPAIPKDKLYCKATMEDLSGYISDPDDFTVQYLKSVDRGVEIKIQCNKTKNVKELVFSIVNGRLLLGNIY
jgi:hypothetical protein